MVPGEDVVHVRRRAVSVHVGVEDGGGVELAGEAGGDGESGWAAADYEDVAGGHEVDFFFLFF